MLALLPLLELLLDFALFFLAGCRLISSKKPLDGVGNDAQQREKGKSSGITMLRSSTPAGMLM